MRRLILRLVMGGAAALATAALAFGALERWSAYRSPLLRTTVETTPYAATELRLAGLRAERAEAKRQRAELMSNLTAEKMVALGREIVHGGRGFCFNCHAIGGEGGGTQGPNLEAIGKSAAERVAGLSAAQYLAQSLFQPEAFVVTGFAPTMPVATGPPIGLDDVEILMVIAYLETLGGEQTVEPGMTASELVPK